MNFKDFIPTKAYNENTPFQIGEIKLTPLYMPGHTHDHYCFYEPSQKIMFTFDIDFDSFGPWYGHRESSISEFKNSLKKIKEFENPDNLFYITPRWSEDGNQIIVILQSRNGKELIIKDINEPDCFVSFDVGSLRTKVV